MAMSVGCSDRPVIRWRAFATLAHELGHARATGAAGNGALMAPTLAETASMFGEMMAFKRLPA